MSYLNCMSHFLPLESVSISLKQHFFSILLPKFFVDKWIPRSPRWLIANNHLDEAHEVLLKYAKYNHMSVGSKNLKHVMQEVRKND